MILSLISSFDIEYLYKRKGPQKQSNRLNQEYEKSTPMTVSLFNTLEKVQSFNY